MKKLSITLLSLLLSLQVFAGQAQVARFSQWFSVLEESLDTSSASTASDKLIKGLNRVAAFNLQALGKVYQGQGDEFKKIRKDFKKLEDSIGEYKKWDDILEEAYNRNASSSKIKNLKKKKTEAKTKLKEILEKKDWLNAKRLKKHRKFVSEYDFGSYSEDKSYVLSHIIDDVEEVAITDYDMTILEEGNGVHELRRDIRWFVIKARILNGLLVFKKNTSYCPIKKYRNLPNEPIANSKYSSLTPSALEKAPCKISQCIFLAAVQKVEQFGDLKDQIESDLNLLDVLEDETPRKYLRELNRLYNELIDTQLLETISKELNRCL